MDRYTAHARGQSVRTRKDRGGNTMAYVIDEKCIACGVCTSECAFDAIAEGDPIFVIDAEKCNDCGQCADVCPVSAPVAE